MRFLTFGEKMKDHRIQFVTFSCLCLLLILSCLAVSCFGGNEKILIENDQDQFKIELPQNWEVSKESVALYAIENKDGSVLILIESQNETLNDDQSTSIQLANKMEEWIESNLNLSDIYVLELSDAEPVQFEDNLSYTVTFQTPSGIENNEEEDLIVGLPTLTFHEVYILEAAGHLFNVSVTHRNPSSADLQLKIKRLLSSIEES